jgi:hypothetical protein
MAALEGRVGYLLLVLKVGTRWGELSASCVARTLPAEPTGYMADQSNYSIEDCVLMTTLAQFQLQN